MGTGEERDDGSIELASRAALQACPDGSPSLTECLREPGAGLPHNAISSHAPAAGPPELTSWPFAVTTSPVDEVQHALVARFADLTRANLPIAPVMAAEVASHSTRLHDRNTKKAHYERLGVSSYWLLDPDGPGALEVLELGDDGRYRTVAEAVGDETVELARPFPVSLSPARQLEGLHRPG